MTRVLTDGFEYGGKPGNFSIPNGWGIEGENAHKTLVIADAKSWGYGSYCLQLYGWAGMWKTLWPSGTSELYMNWSWRLITNYANSAPILWRTVAGNDVLIFRWVNATTMNIEKGGGTVLASIGVNSSWASWALRLKNTAGSYQVELNVNGTPTVNYSDAAPIGATPNLAQIILWPYNGEVRYDDIAINDTTGAEDNSWPGEISIKALAPNGNGDMNQWAGSDGNSTDNYLLVDEVGPSSADYVRTATNGAEDWYNIAAPPTLTTGDVLDKVFLHCFPRRVSAGTQTVSMGMKIGGATVWESAFTVIYMTYMLQLHTGVRNLNPDTGLKWTLDNIRHLQIGIRMNS